MKKKVLLSILVLFLLSVFTVVNAEQISVLNLSENTKAKAPTIVPNAGDTMYATLTDEFDLGRLKFKNASGGVYDYNGASKVRKIILSKTLNYSTTDLSINNVLGSDWFTAYCLDGELNYPQYGFYSSIGFLDAIKKYKAASTPEQREAELNNALSNVIRGALVNNKSLQNVLKLANGYVIGPQVTYALEEGKTINDYFVINGTNIALKEGNLKVYVKEMSYTSLSYTVKTITATDLAQGGTTVEVDGVPAYELTFKAEDVAFDKYTTTINFKEKSAYEHALWILEHSYPTITLEKMFELVEIDESLLLTELRAFDERIPANSEGANAEIVANYEENYIYSTIQYAIWKVVGGKANLGDGVVNSTQLDKLFTFYTQDRAEYTGYSTLTGGGEIKTTAPASGKELYKTTDSTFTYGPYSVKFSGIMANDSSKDISLSINNSNSTGIKIVNESGTEINSIAPDTKFYVEVSKSADIGSVEIGLSVSVQTFTPSKNRGRIYNPQYVLSQNVMSGGKIGTGEVTDKFTISVNPKTGVEDVTVLLMVTLVAFSLGYLVISYKGKGSFLN